MSSMNWKSGMTRLCLLIGVLWIAGMGYYQYDQAKHADDNSVTISLSKDKAFRIDAGGMKQEDKSSLQAQRLAWVFLPPLLLLLAIPLGGWLAGGFKKGQA